MLATDHAGSGTGAFAPFLKQPARFDILSRRVPALGGANSAKEREAFVEVTALLGQLNACVGDFRAGLKLLDHAEAHAEFDGSWAPIACRDAAGALSDFRAALKQMGEALRRCPSLAEAKRGIRAIEQRFAATFPSDRTKANGSKASARRHTDMCDATISASVTREGRCVKHASGGRQMRFELSEPSLWTLVALRNDVFGAFESEAN